MNGEADFLDKVRGRFAGSVAQLDARTLARLREARTRALAAAGSHTPWWRARWALPAGVAAVAGAIVIAGVVWLNVGTSPNPNVPFAAHSNEDMAIELSGDNLDMYADMDFYRWLQVQQQDASQTDSGNQSNG